ncbi:MAG: class I adenylate-forming enzyme family protein [Acidimicrobiales bacterium]
MTTAPSTEADLWTLVEERASATPNLELLVDRGGRRVDCATFRDQAAAMAAGLLAMGIKAGDVVAWELPTWIEAIELAAALHRLGTVQVPIIAIYRDAEVLHCCREAGARWLITAREFRGFDFDAMGGRIGAQLGIAHVVMAPGSTPSADPAILPPLSPRPDDQRWIFYTSGTTAQPKGARHTDRALAWVGAQMAHRMGLGEGDRYALVFPFPHVGGILLLYSALIAGFTHLVEDAFDPAATIDFLRREGVTHAGTGTPFHLAYLAAQRARPDETLFPRLRCCPGGAAAKPAGLHAAIKRELGGAGIVSSWGLTEAPVLTFSTLDDADETLASTEGMPMPGVELRVVGSDGASAGPGQEGELQVRGPQVTAGYVDASLDAAAFVDGWFRTGDLGVVDDRGYISITGRLKDVIIRNGENISAKQVEDLLFDHPKVADVAVIGLPDDRTGERVCAVVATAVGEVPLGLAELTAFLRDAGLRAQAIPEQVEHVEAIPRNPAGKVTKAALKERF